MSLERLALLLSGLVLMCCAESTSPTVGPSDAGMAGDAAPAEVEQLSSRAPRARFIGGARYAQRLARGLELEGGALCLELGVLDCVEAHRIALGGVDAYRLGIREPLDPLPNTAPMIVDRIALSACTDRAQRDEEEPAARVLPESRDARLEALFVRLLGRTPTEAEAVIWREAPGEPGVLGATLDCYAVATLEEALFY